MSNPAPLVDGEPVVYALVGAPFGDLELDVGKSVRWLEYFCDKMFITDVNLGDPRYWIINWTKSFPHAEHGITSINYFERPVAFRKEQFRQADAMYHMSNDSWVLWVDGTEGLSFDNASLPDDYDFNAFKSFIYREIARAVDAGEDKVVLPLFVFVRSGQPMNVTYDQVITDPSVPPVLQPVTVPYYLPYQGMTRMMQVSALRSPSFDWASIDQPSTPSADVKAQIISYAYAHWHPLDIPPGHTEVPDLSEANDDGFRMRKMISKVRPIEDEFPSDSWHHAWDDETPSQVPGPWAVYTLINTNPDFVPITDWPMEEPDPAALGVKVPLYDTVFRFNLRDGVWYEGDAVSGNTPLTWNSDLGQWMSYYSPDAWPTQGTESPVNPDFVHPSVPIPIPDMSIVVVGLTAMLILVGGGSEAVYFVVWDTVFGTGDEVTADTAGNLTAEHTYGAPGNYVIEVYIDPNGAGVLIHTEGVNPT